MQGIVRDTTIIEQERNFTILERRKKFIKMVDFEGYIYISTIIQVVIPAVLVLLFVCCILLCCMTPHFPEETRIINTEEPNCHPNTFELEPLQTKDDNLV